MSGVTCSSGWAVKWSPRLIPTGDGAELEMLEHLADNVEAFLGWEVLHADPTRPDSSAARTT